jgi:pyruvate, water dikinase
MQSQFTTPAPDVLPLTECLEDRAASIGGKALGLGALLRHGLPVPPGFAVTADAFRRSITDSGLDAEIARLLEQSGSYAGDAAASSAIQALFTQDVLGAEVGDAIEAA